MTLFGPQSIMYVGLLTDFCIDILTLTLVLYNLRIKVYVMPLQEVLPSPGSKIKSAAPVGPAKKLQPQTPKPAPVVKAIKVEEPEEGSCDLLTDVPFGAVASPCHLKACIN